MMERCAIKDCPREATDVVGDLYCEYHKHDTERQAIHVHGKLNPEQQQRYSALFNRTKIDLLAREMTDEQLLDHIHGVEDTLTELIFAKKTEIIAARDILHEREEKLTKAERDALREKDKKHKNAEPAKKPVDKKVAANAEIEKVFRQCKGEGIKDADAKLIANFVVKQKISFEKAKNLVLCADGL